MEEGQVKAPAMGRNQGEEGTWQLKMGEKCSLKLLIIVQIIQGDGVKQKVVSRGRQVMKWRGNGGGYICIHLYDPNFGKV